jgi:hypothetical protein
LRTPIALGQLCCALAAELTPTLEVVVELLSWGKC